jgi:chitin synthase
LGKTTEEFIYPDYDTVPDPRRYLTSKEILFQRSFFIGVVFVLNLSMGIAAFLGRVGIMVLIFMVLIKSKDVLSCIIQVVGLPARWIKRRIWGQPEITSKVILSLIPAYSESEEQIVKTIFSLRDNGTEPHWQVMCVILDGKPRDIKKHMTRHIASFTRKFETIKNTIGELNIVVGFLEDVPVIVLEKVKNAGKKDSLVLCHDLFNFPRDNMPEHSQVLRRELWSTIIPQLVAPRKLDHFDFIFCTDADSTIHHGALASLTNCLIRDPKAIAACGLVLRRI